MQYDDTILTVIIKSLCYETLSLSRNHKGSLGFTLVELMIVIAIIGILAATLFPSMQGYLARSKDTKTISQGREIALALEARYGDKGDGRILGGGALSLSGYGHFDFKSPSYPRASLEVVEDEGYITKGRILTVTVRDPAIGNFKSAPQSRFFYNPCARQRTFTLSVRLLQARQVNVIDAVYGCGGVGGSPTSWQSYRDYGFTASYNFGEDCIVPKNTSGTGLFYNCQGMNVSDELYNHALLHVQPYFGAGTGYSVW